MLMAAEPLSVRIQMPREIAEMCERLASGIIEDTEAHTVMLMLGLEHMDLVAAGVERAVESWPKFNAGRGIQPQTFLYLPIKAGIFDYLRREGSQDRRIKGLAGLNPKVDKDRELCDWLKDVYEAAKRVYVAGRLNQGRRRFAAPQLAAVAELVRHKNLSCRQCARLLAGRPDLLDILKMRTVPHWTWINRASELAKRSSQVATEAIQNTPEVATAAA